MRAEDSWFVAKERQAGRVEPDYGGGDRVKDQRTLGKGREADRRGYVPRDDRVPASLWDYVRREWVNLEDLAWDLKMSPWQRNDLGQFGVVGARARRLAGVHWEGDGVFVVGADLSPSDTLYRSCFRSGGDAPRKETGRRQAADAPLRHHVRFQPRLVPYPAAGRSTQHGRGGRSSVGCGRGRQ